jgi:hypothetical protein
VVVLGIWLIFGTMALAGLLMVAMMRSAGFIFGVIGAGMATISIIMLWKTTRNYLARKKVDERHDA